MNLIYLMNLIYSIKLNFIFAVFSFDLKETLVNLAAKGGWKTIH